MSAPDVILVPARARGLLLAEKLAARFNSEERYAEIVVAVAKRRSGRFVLENPLILRGQRVVAVDAAAGHGDTLDELIMLAASAGAASVSGAVLLSRLSEACEEALDCRLDGGFTRLYSMPVRPITVRDRVRSQCPVCQRRQELRDAISELPGGPIKDLASKLASSRRFRARNTEIRDAQPQPTQIGLFPLGKCRRSVASGITLHALHAARGDGMAPLRLPEIGDGSIPASNRAALVANLPTSTLEWSGEVLVQDLKAYLKRGAERDVWVAVADLFARAGSSVWVDSLSEAISGSERRGSWMDDRFWAWMVCATYRLIRERPESREPVHARLLELVTSYGQTSASRGLRGMLAIVALTDAR
jgi:hypothetical protein